MYKIKIGPNVCKCCNLTIDLAPGRHRVIPPQISFFTCLFVTCVSERIKGSNESLQFTLHTLCNFRNIDLSNSYDLSSPRTFKVLMNFRNKWKRFIRYISEWLNVCNYTHICSRWEIVTRLTPKSKFQDPTRLLILKSPVSCWGLT